MSGNFPSNHENNCASFLALKIGENWHLEIKSIRNDRKRLVEIAEDVVPIFHTIRSVIFGATTTYQRQLAFFQKTITGYYPT